MKKFMILIAGLIWTAGAFANQQVVKSTAKELARDYQVTSVEMKTLDGPFVKVDETIYKVQISRNYALGMSSTSPDTFRLYLLSETRSIGPTTEKKIELFRESAWDYFHNEVPNRYKGSWSGGQTNMQFTLKASPEIQQKYLIRMIEHLAGKLK